MSNIAAVVVTYNRKEMLLECLRHLLNGSVVPDILVIDNASSDGTAEAVKPLLDRGGIHYFNTGANLGGAGGFNFGIRKAVELGYEYLWIMDDDCMPNSDALEMLIKTGNKLHGDYGFLSSKVLWKDGSICRMNVQRAKLTKNVKDFSQPLIPVVMASFVSLYMSAEVVREMGLPIKEFFIWTDDWEYTRRISRKRNCYLVTNSIVSHHSKANIKADVSSESIERLDRFKCLYRNDVVLYRREGLKGFGYECIRLIVHSLRVLKNAHDYRWARLRSIWEGTIAGLRFHPRIEYIDCD